MAIAAVVVWTDSRMRRLLEQRAAAAGVDLTTFAESILREAVDPPKRRRNNGAPALPSQDKAGARGPDERVRVES